MPVPYQKRTQGFSPVIRWYIRTSSWKGAIALMKRFLCLILALCILPVSAYASSLSEGSSGQKVAALQSRLVELGLLSGAADGIYGAQTASAVKEAQRLLRTAGYSIKETGQADQRTLSLIHDPEAEETLLTLRRGSKGQRVRDLQNRLIDLGFLREMADGDFGSKTETAVRAFQKRMKELGAENGETDGVVTTDLLDLLNSDLSNYGLQAPVYFDESDPLSLTAEHLYAHGCILIDVPSGAVLFENNADQQMYPASTTKIVTLLLALQKGQLDQIHTVPASASDIPEDSSRMPVLPGEKLRMIDLLHGLMIRSGNDAANAVAEICSGSVEAFVDEMNTFARDIGMEHSHFVNPHGYHDENHYSTARDLAVAARLGLTDPVFCEIVTCMSYTLPATKNRDSLPIQNTNEIFDPASDAYIAGAAGVKSGYTSLAGFCYVGAAQRDGKTLIAVILDVPGRDRGWTDLKRLFEYGFAL